MRQKRLAQRSRRVLRRPPVPSGEEANLPEPLVTSEQFLPQEELNRLAAPISTEQRAVREATASVLDSITLQQDTLRQTSHSRLRRTSSELPATEVDPVVDLLAETVAAQDQALANLAPEAVRWPQANTALHTAAGRMQQALDALRSLQPPTTDEEDEAMASRNVGDDDENMDGLESESQDKQVAARVPRRFPGGAFAAVAADTGLHLRGDYGRGGRQPAEASPAKCGAGWSQSGEELVSIRTHHSAERGCPLAVDAGSGTRGDCRSTHPGNRQPLHLRALHAASRGRERRPSGNAGVARPCLTSR